jgi:aspartate/methionine/tyrosine aminotransferase
VTPISHRLAARADAIAPFEVVQVMERAWELERAGGPPVIRLCVGEPDFGTPPQVVAQAQAHIAEGQVAYTSSLGIPSLRHAIADHYTERYGVSVPWERVVVTTGASGALILALAALVDPATGCSSPTPATRATGASCGCSRARPAGIPVDASTAWQLTAALVAEHWDERTRAALVASPANPTGTAVPAAELAAMAEAVGERGGTLVVDEIYAELTYDGPPRSALSVAPEAVVVNSFSKTWGMTGWRLGWLVLPEWLVGPVERLAQNLYISPPGPSQHGALACFTPEVRAEVDRRVGVLRERRDLLVDGLRRLGFDVPVVPTGAFYVYAGCSRFGDARTVSDRLLQEARVAVTPGTDFGTHRATEHLRFSYCVDTRRITEALDRMAAALPPPD